MFHEYNEVYLYWSMLQQETDARIKAIWELHCNMEIGQLQAACELLRTYEGVEPEEILPPALPDTPVTFEPNKEYVREILATQSTCAPTASTTSTSTTCPSDHRYFEYQADRQPATAHRASRSSTTTAPRTAATTATRPKAPTRSPSCKRRRPPASAERSETMPMLTPTKADGATAKPNEVLYVDPACQVTDDDARRADARRRPERGVRRRLVQRHAHPRALRRPPLPIGCRDDRTTRCCKRRYEEFGDETQHHVEVLEQLITALGGNPNYVSPTARAVDGMDSNLVESTFMLNGSLDLMTARDGHARRGLPRRDPWITPTGSCCRSSSTRMPRATPATRFRAAVDEVEGQEDEHLEWARTTKARLVMLQATGSMAATVGLATEELLARVRNWLSD